MKTKCRVVTLKEKSTETSKLNGTRYRTRTGTIGAESTYGDPKFATCGRKRKIVSDSPHSETVCGRFRTLIEHISKQGVCPDLNIKLRPIGFPTVFT